MLGPGTAGQARGGYPTCRVGGRGGLLPGGLLLKLRPAMSEGSPGRSPMQRDGGSAIETKRPSRRPPPLKQQRRRQLARSVPGPAVLRRGRGAPAGCAAIGQPRE